MMANREKIAINEYYHVYNRGVDKRNIITDREDSIRLVESIQYFNSKFPIRSLRDLTLEDRNTISKDQQNQIVDVVAYCLNPNHYHLLLREITEGGISEFMKRINGGYTWYFNKRHHRSGALFQGVFKSVRIDSNEQLLHVSAYINLNDKIHKYSGFTAGLVKSSWGEYKDPNNIQGHMCNKQIVLEQFKSTGAYIKFAESAANQIINSKASKKGIPEFIIGQHFYE